MKIYTVYLKPDGEKTLQSAVLVPEGFSWAALIPGYNLLWALMNKMWLLLFIFIFLYILSFPQAHLQGGWILAAASIKAVIFVFLAIWANDFWRVNLRQRGYYLAAVVSGRNESEAQLRFFEQNTVGSHTNFHA